MRLRKRLGSRHQQQVPVSHRISEQNATCLSNNTARAIAGDSSGELATRHNCQPHAPRRALLRRAGTRVENNRRRVKASALSEDTLDVILAAEAVQEGGPTGRVRPQGVLVSYSVGGEGFSAPLPFACAAGIRGFAPASFALAGRCASQGPP